MIYQYLVILLLSLFFYLVYQKSKNKIPDNIRKNISSYKFLILIFYILFLFLVIGSPVKVESTSLSGKADFSLGIKNIKEKQEAANKPENEDFRKKGSLIEQQKKEKENEINDKPE